MAMLAERKKKQKWSTDPRNTNWSNDTNRFGYQMLSKMGWESGKGLGAKEDGVTAIIKTVKRKDNLGFGAGKSNEDNWLSHQLAFDDLLSQLNQHSENDTEDRPKKKKKKHEMEKTARQSRKRVFYNKFIRSKDLSSKSAEDMACVFGQRSKSEPVTPQELSEDEESDVSTTSCPPRGLYGVQTINSGQNIQDYFQKKMMEIKAAREKKEKEEAVSTGKEESTDVDSTGNHEDSGQGDVMYKKKKSDKKRKRRIQAEEGDSESGEKKASELDEVSVVSPEMRGEVSDVTSEIDELDDVEYEPAREWSKVEGKRDKKKKTFKNRLLSTGEEGLADNTAKEKKKIKLKRSLNEGKRSEQLFEKDDKEIKTKTGEGKNFCDEFYANEIQLKREKKRKKKEKYRTSE